MADTSGDPIAALSEVDPGEVGDEEFVRLLAAASELADGDDGVDLSAMSPRDFARLISRASGSQVEAVMARRELREPVLDEIFRRMSEHVKPDRLPRSDAVVHWRITGPDKDEQDRYEIVIAGSDGSGGEDGVSVAVHKEQRHERARVTIRLGPVEFLKLASGNASAPLLFMRGKIKVKGDLAFAAGMTDLFRIPQA